MLRLEVNTRAQAFLCHVQSESEPETALLCNMPPA